MIAKAFLTSIPSGPAAQILEVLSGLTLQQAHDALNEAERCVNEFAVQLCSTTAFQPAESASQPHVPTFPSVVPAPLDDFLQHAIEEATRTDLARLMAGAVTCPPEYQHEWLSTAQQVLDQRLQALAWHASQKTVLVQPVPPEPAA